MKTISYTWDLVVASPAVPCKAGVGADAGTTGFGIKLFLGPAVFLLYPIFSAANGALT